MNIDLCILAALGLFAVVGFYSGAIQQISHWIGLALAFVCAKPAAAALAPGLAARLGWPPPLTAVGLSALLLPVIMIVAALLSRAVLNAVIPGDQRNLPDRLAGFVLGAAKAGAIAWAGLSLLLAFEKPLTRLHAGLAPALESSSAAAFTRDHAFFASLAPTALERFQALSALRGDPKRARALLKDPALKTLLETPGLKRALEKGDASALLKNPELKKLLEDPALGQSLRRLEEI